MKKLVSLLVLFLTIALSATSQTMQIAALTHEGEIKNYTSADALRKAYNDAVDGDVITLSSGSFNSVNLEKRITVRGAGMGVQVNNTDPFIEPTMLKGSFDIKADGNGINNLILEGVACSSRVNLKGVINAWFSKCKFEDIKYSTGYGGYENVTWINCVFDDAEFCYNASMNFYSCLFVSAPPSASNSTFSLTNCVLYIPNSNYNYGSVTYNNSIFINETGKVLYPYGTCFNSIWKGPLSENSYFISTMESHHNSIVPDDVELFKEGTFYQLTDQAKTYLGGDGTEVGLYGGSLPFDPTPTNPQITKFQVASKTTADGRLAVDIEVQAK